MDLYFLRHAIAEEKLGNKPDADRRLTEEGIKKMRRAAEGMKALDLEIDLVLSSPYARARETAEIAAEVLKLGKIRFTDALASDGGAEELLKELGEHGGKKGIMLVGHEPYMSRIISVLIFGSATVPITLKKGGLCKVAIKRTLQYGRCGSLEWLLTPAQMRSM